MQSDCLKLNCITLVWVYLCNDTEIQSSLVTPLALAAKFFYCGYDLQWAVNSVNPIHPRIDNLHFDDGID